MEVGGFFSSSSCECCSQVHVGALESHARKPGFGDALRERSSFHPTLPASVGS